MRLKLSTTRKPLPAGVPTSSLQLLVPRSSAAKAGANTLGVPPIAGAESSTMTAEAFRILERRIVLGWGRRFKHQMTPAPARPPGGNRRWQQFDNPGGRS